MLVKGHKDDWGVGVSVVQREAEKAETIQPEDGKQSTRKLTSVCNWQKGINKVETDSSQLYLVKGQETMGANWNIRNSTWTWENTFLLWDCSNTASGCPEWLYSFQLLRRSRSYRIQSLTTCSSWHYFSKVFGLDDLKSFFHPQSFCDSVILSNVFNN